MVTNIGPNYINKVRLIYSQNKDQIMAKFRFEDLKIWKKQSGYPLNYLK